MEKNHRKDAKKYLQEALVLTNAENHEIMRCYGLCEYWYGNREKGVSLVKEAFSMSQRDAEVIYNLIELYMLEQKYAQANKMITFFYEHRDNLETLDKNIDFYDQKISLFERYVKMQLTLSSKKK